MRDSLNRVKQVVDKVRHIQEEAEARGDGAAKYITDRCNAIGRDEHERLNVVVDKATGALVGKPNCSHRYYALLMNDYQNGVKALGFKHHAIDRNVNGFLRKYSNKIQGLNEKLDPSLPIGILRENLIKLRATAVSGSEFRRDLGQLRIEHHAFYMFSPKGAIKDWIRDDSKKSLNRKLHSQILVNPEWVKATAESLIGKKNASVTDLAIGIVMATGRRVTEIMKTAEFKAIDSKTLIFSGQLKTKNRRLFEEISSYSIPTLIDAEKVVKALQTLRKATSNEKLSFLTVLGERVESTVGAGDKKDYYHNFGVQKKYESTINRAIRSLFNGGGFSIKTCRALYTEVTYEDHALPGETRSAYRHRVLGHSQVETQLYYDAFKLDSSVESIKAMEDAADPKNKGLQQALVDYLALADNEVNNYIRAPKIKVMHEWLKDKVANGLAHAEITPSFIRRWCLIDGKQTNLNTIKKYLDEFVKIGDFEAPKPEPKTDKEKEMAALQEAIDLAADELLDIERQLSQLDNERDEITERLEEIEEEEMEVESSKGEKESEIEKLQEQLDELDADEGEDELPEIDEDDEDDSDVEDDIDWPDPSEITISAKKSAGKWLVEAVVMGHRFEQITGGTKKSAIESLRDQYKKETE
ncbi:protelomerase family protein [Marinomonas arenicola]|uniref:protelomerase family protein n=1 Tax=Marinomonas arenicola TaxID=569601 RepID=UPI00311FFCED